MQKFLYFEIGMATRDRPKIFQVITLVLFAFSVTIVLIGSITHLASSRPYRQIVKTKHESSYTRYILAAQPVADLQK